MKSFGFSLVAVVLLSACGADSTSAPIAANTPAGAWHLKTVDHTSLPVDIGAGNAILSDDLTLASDGSYLDVIRQRLSGAEQTLRLQGTWSQNGGLITGIGSTGNVWRITWATDSLVSTAPSGSVFVYRR